MNYYNLENEEVDEENEVDEEEPNATNGGCNEGEHDENKENKTQMKLTDGQDEVHDRATNA